EQPPRHGVTSLGWAGMFHHAPNVVNPTNATWGTSYSPALLLLFGDNPDACNRMQLPDGHSRETGARRPAQTPEADPSDAATDRVGCAHSSGSAKLQTFVSPDALELISTPQLSIWVTLL